MQIRFRANTLLAAALWLGACGDDAGRGTLTDTDPDPDGGADVAPDTGPDSDANPWYDSGWTDGVGDPEEHCSDEADNDGDGDVDCGDSDCAGRLACAGPQTAEREPNARPETGQVLTLPLFVAGNLHAYTEDGDGNRADDVDWYVFAVDEPTLIEWEFDEMSGPALPRFTLVGVDDDTAGVARQLDVDTPSWRRQAWLPVAGAYGVEVRDTRNVGLDSDEFPYGGPSYDYVLRVERDAFVPISTSLPLVQGVRPLGAGNPLPVFALELDAGAVLESEVVAQRLVPSSGLDAMLYLVRQSDAAVLGFIDDTPISTFDPLLRTDVLAEDTSAWLVLDAYRIGHTSNYELYAELLAPSLDREPNDPAALAYPAELGVVIEGEVSAPFLRFRSVITDSDYFVFAGGRSASYTVEVRPTGASLDAAVRTGFTFRSTTSGSILLSEIFQADPPDTETVVLEASSLFDSPFVVEVLDRRNRFEEGADPVGGTDFGYELELTPLERQVADLTLPYTASEELSELGEVDWYRFETPGRVRLEVSALEATEGVEPFAYLAGDDDAYVRRGSRGFYHLNNVTRTHRLAVVDRRAGGGDDYDYELMVEAVAHTPVAEVEPNDGPPVGGQILGELPVWVDGVVTGTNDQDFDIDVFVLNLAAGEAVTIETAAGVDADQSNADTLLALSGPGLAAPLTDNNSGFGTASRLSAFVATEGGAFELAVTPVCNADECFGGDYGLAVWSVPAPEPPAAE